MLWIHPILQIIATALALFALRLGWTQFQINHLGKIGEFLWMEHTKFGKYAHILWMAGLVLGQFAVAQTWGNNTITGIHYQLGQWMMPCIAIGYITGVIMDRKRMARKYLPMIHAAVNTLAILLALALLGTGLVVIRDFVLG